MIVRFQWILCVSALLLSCAAFGQERTPAEHMKRDVGDWNVEIRMYTAPGADPIVSRGVETNIMIGSKWLIGHFEGEIMGAQFEGSRRTGFDPKKKIYVMSWVDSTSAYPTEAEGAWNEQTQTMTLTGTGKDPFGNDMKTKMTAVYHRDGSRTTTMYRLANGDAVKMMEFRYTRPDDAPR